jgi:hypothetical protein
VAAPSVFCRRCQSTSAERSTAPVDLNALHSFCSIVGAAVCSTKRVLSELFNSESRDPMYHVNALHSCNKIIALFINKCTSTSAKVLVLKTCIGTILLWFGATCQKKGNVYQLCTAFDTKLSQNSLEIEVECPENNVEESLICFLFGCGGTCQNADTRYRI